MRQACPSLHRTAWKGINYRSRDLSRKSVSREDTESLHNGVLRKGKDICQLQVGLLPHLL